MAKVYLPRFAIYTLSFTLNFLVLGIYSFSEAAVDSPPKNENPEASENISETIESKILSEIDRVRTNPQDYANWLESQKQYYDGVWLKLPGEEPVRTNKGLKALEEAIAFLREQKPLPPLNLSDFATKDANNKLKDFATTNNIQHISYGRVTPEGIVMSWVVDELFPDRRRRNNLLDPDFKNTGVSCQNDPRYHKVCAISYFDSTTETVATQPKTPVKTEPATPTTKPEVTENTTTKAETNLEDRETSTATLPNPPEVPPAPPETEDSNPKPEETVVAGNNEDLKQEQIDENINIEPEEDLEAEANTKNESEDLEANIPEDEKELTEDEEAKEDLEVAGNTENESEDIEANIPEDEKELTEDEEAKENIEVAEDKEEVFEAEEQSEEREETVATNSNHSRLLENVERGALEEGDRVIAEDGSFYDSFPLEGKSGESFTISLESEEFDPFVALIDAKGNIVEQNDDINEENSNSRIRVTIPEDGVYNVIVNAYDEGGSGQYVLTVTR